MAVKLNAYRISLRHKQAGTHVQTLDAVSLAEAVTGAQAEAADMSGGEPGDWAVSSTEQIRGPIVRRAA